jgi:hypothetical protein
VHEAELDRINTQFPGVLGGDVAELIVGDVQQLQVSAARHVITVSD